MTMKSGILEGTNEQMNKTEYPLRKAKFKKLKFLISIALYEWQNSLSYEDKKKLSSYTKQDLVYIAVKSKKTWK